MGRNFVEEITKHKTFVAPSKESLLEKIMGLEEATSRYENAGLNKNQEHTLHIVQDYIQSAKECMKGFPSHPHLIWNLLHRADEHLLFLMPHDELYARALDVATTFDLTITEKKVREEMLGEKGKLTIAVKDLEKASPDVEKDRYLVRDALQYLNENVDTNYWILSMNTLTSVLSAILLGLGICMIIFVPGLDPAKAMVPPKMGFIAILGCIGAFLSNLITKENFLYVRGGPFWRYLLHNLMARPILGAFAAIFILWIEKSKWIFSITSAAVDKMASSGQAAAVAVSSNSQSAIITINVSETALPYAYVIIAVISGFAAEKILRNMIDRVLKRLEEKAEKTKETKTETTKTGETA